MLNPDLITYDTLKNSLNQVFNYQEYLQFMESKKVENKFGRTNTFLDFLNDEQIKYVQTEKEYNLSGYDPTPKEIKEHFEFIDKVYKKLIEEYPDSKILINLKKEEFLEIYASYNWYEVIYKIRK